MAVNSEPRLRTFKAEGTIRAFRFVKWGTDNGEMLESNLNDKSMGIYQGTKELAAGDFGEVALPGGGALLELVETAAKGKLITSDADGKGEVVDAAGEFYGAIAYEAAAANDIIGVEVTATTESHSSDA